MKKKNDYAPLWVFFLCFLVPIAVMLAVTAAILYGYGVRPGGR